MVPVISEKKTRSLQRVSIGQGLLRNQFIYQTFREKKISVVLVLATLSTAAGIASAFVGYSWYTGTWAPMCAWYMAGFGLRAAAKKKRCLLTAHLTFVSIIIFIFIINCYMFMLFFSHIFVFSCFFQWLFMILSLLSQCPTKKAVTQFGGVTVNAMVSVMVLTTVICLTGKATSDRQHLEWWLI